MFQNKVFRTVLEQDLTEEWCWFSTLHTACQT